MIAPKKRIRTIYQKKKSIAYGRFCPKEAVVVFRMSAEDRRSASVPARSHPSHRGGASQHLDKNFACSEHKYLAFSNKTNIPLFT